MIARITVIASLALVWTVGAIFFLGHIVMDEIDAIGRKANPPPFRNGMFYLDCAMSLVWPLSIPLSAFARWHKRKVSRG